MHSILAVDDSVTMRQLLAHVLRAAGHEVAEARDGLQALDQARERAFDLVITDHHMPGMDGLALTRALRALPAYRQVPILVLTTESDPALKADGRAAGATGWLQKPFDPGRLIEVIGKVAAGAGATP